MAFLPKNASPKSNHEDTIGYNHKMPDHEIFYKTMMGGCGEEIERTNGKGDSGSDRINVPIFDNCRISMVYKYLKYDYSFNFSV